jgi:hypothetical protein
VSIESNTLDFLNLYLGPFLPQKNLDLLKLDLIKRARRKRTEDPTLSEVALIRQTLETVSRRRKTLLAQLNPVEISNPAFLELLKLAPADALLLCSSRLFPIPMEALSLALQQPEESLRYRVERLSKMFQEQDLSIDSLKNPTQPRPARTKSMRRRGKDLLTSFHALPMGIRFLIETSFILVSLLLLLWFIPEMRNRYETSIQARINEYLVESALLDAPAPEGTSKEPKSPLIQEGATLESEENITKSSSEAPAQKRQPKVNEGETWRFSFTGSATNEMEAGILEALRSLGVSEQKPLNVPGGIQFDFVLETGKLLNLKTQLESTVGELQRKSVIAQTTPLAYANMSWYKKKNMGTRKIPTGHVQVIVWVSTL